MTSWALPVQLLCGVWLSCPQWVLMPQMHTVMMQQRQFTDEWYWPAATHYDLLLVPHLASQLMQHYLILLYVYVLSDHVVHSAGGAAPGGAGGRSNGLLSIFEGMTVRVPEARANTNLFSLRSTPASDPTQ
jgi:hypothetical protein